MRTRIKTRAGIGAIVSCAALLAGAPSASALSGAGLIAANADRPFIGHGSSVYNTDTNNEHWVYGYLGVFYPASGSTTLNFSGYGLGESRTCTVYAMSITSPGWTWVTHVINGAANGAFTTSGGFGIPSAAHVTVRCNLGRATSSQYTYLYSVWVTQTP